MALSQGLSSGPAARWFDWSIVSACTAEFHGVGDAKQLIPMRMLKDSLFEPPDGMKWIVVVLETLRELTPNTLGPRVPEWDHTSSTRRQLHPTPEVWSRASATLSLTLPSLIPLLWRPNHKPIDGSQLHVPSCRRLRFESGASLAAGTNSSLEPLDGVTRYLLVLRQWGRPQGSSILWDWGYPKLRST